MGKADSGQNCKSCRRFRSLRLTHECCAILKEGIQISSRELYRILRRAHFCRYGVCPATKVGEQYCEHVRAHIQVYGGADSELDPGVLPDDDKIRVDQQLSPGRSTPKCDAGDVGEALSRIFHTSLSYRLPQRSLSE